MWRRIWGGAVGIFWLISLFIDSSGVIASLIIFLAYWLFIILLIAWLLNRLIPVWRRSTYRIKTKYLLTPIALVIVSFISLLLNLINTPTAMLTEGTTSQQLAYMKQTDQNDRLAILPFFLMPERDTMRVNGVIELLTIEDDLSVEDKYNAAIVLQHGTKPEHYEMAYHLSLDANETGYENDLWMLAYDRWQLSIGNEQVYNTQSSVRFGFGGMQRDTP